RLNIPDHSLLGMILGSLAQDVQIRDPVQEEASVDQQVKDRGIKQLPRPLTFEADAARCEIRFAGSVALRQRHAKIILSLLPAYQDGQSAGRGMAGFAFCHSRDLAKRLNLSEQSLRQYLTGLRRELKEQFLAAFGTQPAIYDVIETDRWRGYRLNPHIRLTPSFVAAA
ncbi:MAG: hypothetical protein JWR00_4239, partial [Rubritepida sp.]|nr:hypothetical protein [Rubritepida sp.]